MKFSSKQSHILQQFQHFEAHAFHPAALISNYLAILKDQMPLFWAGIYEVGQKNTHQLYLSIYQGGLACQEITVGKGVCGQVAALGKAMRIDDVQKLSNYIACHPEPRAELVLPGFVNGQLSFVLDLDSVEIGFFSANDQAFLGQYLMPFFERAMAKLRQAYVANH